MLVQVHKSEQKRQLAAHCTLNSGVVGPFCFSFCPKDCNQAAEMMDLLHLSGCVDGAFQDRFFFDVSAAGVERVEQKIEQKRALNDGEENQEA